ncbi:MAG: ribonuclease P protein component [Synergistaceae bacterium]|jgi:ribonuclease P protein component|nr:ribonuclease P protein component [Synergistaceae bacterium]
MSQGLGFPFGPNARLKKGWEFDAVFRTGRQLRGELVRLCYLRKQGERTRIGLAVGKKIAGAVGRSRGRRVLRESARRLLPWIEDGVWIVLSLREKALGSNADAVYADTASLLKRAGLMGSGWRGPNWRADERPSF